MIDRDLLRKHTLIIPTYNRVRDLQRLLKSVIHQGVGPLIVVDSSIEPHREHNKGMLKTLGHPITYIEMPSDTPPYTKFLRGAEAAETPYCSYCADDDVVFMDAVCDALRFLDANDDYAVAQGQFCSFFEEHNHFIIDHIVYSGPSVDNPEPIVRLRDILIRYELVIYGVTRTEAMRHVFRRVIQMPTVLAGELMSATLMVLLGRVKRLPGFYYARNTAPSHSYSGWHPHQFLIKEPQWMFDEYVTYRQTLVDEFFSVYENTAFGVEEVVKIVDLSHLIYLTPMLNKDLLVYMVNDAISRVPWEQAVRQFWQSFVHGVRPHHRTFNYDWLMGLASLPKIEGLVHRWPLATRDGLVRRRTIRGNARTYRLNKEVLQGQLNEGGRFTRHHAQHILNLLDTWDD